MIIIQHEACPTRVTALCVAGVRVAAETAMFFLVTTLPRAYGTSCLVDMCVGGWSMKVGIYRNLMSRLKTCRAVLPYSPTQLWRISWALGILHGYIYVSYIITSGAAIPQSV
jgi:hypothetical protein